MVPMELVREHCGNDTCLKGNLNPVDLMTKTPDEVFNICLDIYKRTTGSLSCKIEFEGITYYKAR